MEYPYGNGKLYTNQHLILFFFYLKIQYNFSSQTDNDNQKELRETIHSCNIIFFIYPQFSQGTFPSKNERNRPLLEIAILLQ